MPEEKLYIGAKLIKAYLMPRVEFLESQGKDVPESVYNELGYRVKYPDGYVSWSPKETFETAYREVTVSEKELM